MFLFKTLRILTLKLGFKKAAAGSVTAMFLKFNLLYNLIILNFSILLYGQKNVSIKTGKKLLVSFIKSKSECYSRWIMSNIYNDIKPLTVSANDICLAAMYIHPAIIHDLKIASAEHFIRESGRQLSHNCFYITRLELTGLSSLR